MSDTERMPSPPWEWRDADELRQAKSTRTDGRYGDAVLVAAYDYDRGAYLRTTDDVRDLIVAAPDLLAACEAVAALEAKLPPFYAYGDNEAACALADAVGEMQQVVARALAKAKPVKP